MITARELKELVKTSKKQIDTIMARIEPELVKRAEAGFTDYACYKETEWHAYPVYRDVEVSTVQQRLIDEYKKLGFGAAVVADGAPYVPRSMDDESQNMHVNHVLVIRW